jgi:hypothetical protein
MVNVNKVIEKATPFVREGIETVFDNVGGFIKSAKTPFAKNRRITQIAKDRGYRRAGSGSQQFFPIDLLYLDKTKRGGRWKLKDPSFTKNNKLKIELDKDGIPISHKITPTGNIDKYGRVARRDEGGKIIGYVKPETLKSGLTGTGNYKRTEKDLEQVQKLRDMIYESRRQQEKITDGYIDDFFIQNPDLADPSKINNNVLAQLQDSIPAYEMGTSKGKKIKIDRIKEKLNKKGLYEYRPRFVPEETKELVKNYLLDNDKWKTLSTPQVIEDLNLQGQISPSTLGKLRRTGFGTNKNLSPVGKNRTSLDKARREFNRMLSLKYGGNPQSPVRNRLAQAFSDYMGDAYGVGKKQGYTPQQIEEGFRFVEDTELAFNTPEGQAYQEMFENIQAINKKRLAEINGERVSQGLEPVSFFSEEVADDMLTMGHARLNAETGKIGAFDLSKVEPETRAKNKKALELGRQLQAAIREDNLPAVDRVISEMIERGIRHEVILPNRKFKGVGEAEGLVDTIDDTFVIGGETPEPFPVEPLAKGGMVGENVIEEPMVDEETGILDYLSDKKKQFEDYTGITKMDESLQDFVEDDLGGNPLRVVPMAIGKMLKTPGNIADSIRTKMDETNEMLDIAADLARSEGNEEKANQIQSVKLDGFDKYGNIVTAPLDTFNFLFGEDLGGAFENMFTDDDDTTIPLSGYFTEDGVPVTITADDVPGKIVGAARTLGLTAAEIALTFTPYQLFKLSKLPVSKITKVLKGALNIGIPGAAFSAGYYSLNSEEDIEENRRNQILADIDAAQADKDAAADKARKEQEDLGKSQNPILNKADGGLIGDYLEVGSIPNTTGFAYGGDVTPGPFAESMQTGLEEEIDIQDLDLGPAYEGFDDLDIFEEAQRGGNEPIEVALNLNKVVGNVPKWVKQGKERFKMAMDNILPGNNTPRTGTDVAIVDDVVENVTPLTRSEPGQIFYHQMEAELERGPKVYNSSKEVYDFLNARGIGKVEVIDSEIKPMLEKLEGMGQPITREMLLGVVRESPIRNVKSGGYGFLSDTLDGEMRSLNYSGYKEKGAIPNTDRERVLYVDPQDLRGDTGNLPSSMSPHSFSEPYVIAWSRLSDRELGGAFTGKTTTFADEIQSDIFQASQRVAGKLAAKMRHMADQGIPFDRIQNDLQKEMMQYFKDKGTVFRESMPSASALKVEYDKLVALQNQLRELSRTPVPEITDEMLTAAKGVEAQQTAILDNLVDKFNLDLNKQLYPNLPFKLRDQWADASIKRDIYEAAYRKFVLKDPNATDYYAITPANLVTKRYTQAGSTKTPQADRIADKKERLERWVRNGMEGDIPNSQYPGVGMYEFYGGPGPDVVTENGKHFTSSMEKTLKRIAKENNVKVEVLPVKIGDDAKDVWNVVNKETGEILGTGDTARQADAIANDLLLEGMKIKVDRTKQFDTAPSFGVELTPSMAEAFKAYMASGGYVGDEEIVGAYGD